MARHNYENYDVIYYDQRKDGRIEYTGRERRVLTRDEAIELSFSAIVVSLAEGFNGKPIYIHEGKHAQFDAHLGWVS